MLSFFMLFLAYAPWPTYLKQAALTLLKHFVSSFWLLFLIFLFSFRRMLHGQRSSGKDKPLVIFSRALEGILLRCFVFYRNGSQGLGIFYDTAVGIPI